MILLWEMLSVLSTNVLCFSVLWFFFYNYGRISWVDVCWAASLGVWSLLQLLNFNPGQNSYGLSLLAAVTLFWSTRLSSHLFLRLRQHQGEDRRYEDIKVRARKSWGRKSYFIFLLNALLSTLLLLPQKILAVSPVANLPILQTLAVLLCLLAIVGESTADDQLKKCLATSPGKTCQSGLWRYSRHPNYFFEWLFWVGVFLCALPAESGGWAITAPITMYLFLNYFTGIRLSEKTSAQRKDFADYQRRTSTFFLLPPRK